MSKFHARPIYTKSSFVPTVSILIPVHNEEAVIKEKIENTLMLNYPSEKIEFLFISDGCTDGTEEIIKAYDNSSIKLIPVLDRKGKAHALNIGMNEANNDILVFSDASIMLDINSIKEIVTPFCVNNIGCVSGEDHIKGMEGEGVYGRYELWLRNIESQVGSIVGASGSFYAQRKEICRPFKEGMAPDFLSVMETVESGYRVVTSSKAYGYMTCLKHPKDEYQRKVRTLKRGMSALAFKKNLLNFKKYGFFSIELLSHKIIRWLVPVFLILLYISNIFLLNELHYQIFFYLQTAFYLTALMAFFNILYIQSLTISKIVLFFCISNLGILTAIFYYLSGERQEIWNPSKR